MRQKNRLTFSTLRLLVVSVLLATFLVGISTPAATAAVGTYSNAAIADKALTYVNQWGGNACNEAKKPGDSGGQCRAFVNCIVWMVSGHTQNLGGSDYFQPFLNAGGVRITDQNQLVKGDIVQVGQGTHTFIIVSRVSGNTFNVVDSNHDGNNNEIVRNYNRTFTLDDTTRAYRLGSVSGNSGGGSVGGVASAKFLGGDQLTAGQVLGSNSYILSQNVKYALIMQSDGNLVLYGVNFQAIWSSGTGGNPGAFLNVQPDGNLVIYAANYRPVWTSNTQGALTRLIVQNDGNVVAYNSGNGAIWNAGSARGDGTSYVGADRLNANQSLSSGQFIRSADNRYALIMQPDGNLVLYGPGYHALWSSGTAGKPGARVTLQGDGNLVVYSASGQALWATYKFGTLGSLILQNDGNLVEYNLAGAPIWNTVTSGKL